MEQQQLLNRLEQLSNFVLEHQQPNGELDMEEAHFLYPTGINMRGLAAAYKITGRQIYLDAILKWTDRVFSQQNQDGSFWASSVQLDQSYGRFVSDTANGMNVAFNILSYLDPRRKEQYLQAIQKFAAWTVQGDEGRPFLLDNGAIGCGTYADDKEKGRHECLECTAISPCTFLTPYYKLTRDDRYLQISTRAVQYILSKQKDSGIYPYISKTWNEVDPQGDQIIHVLNYVLEGLIYYYEHSGIEFFDPLATSIRHSVKKSCQWLVENQKEDGRWNDEALGNNASKSAGLVLPLVWYVRTSGQEASFKNDLPRVKNAIDKAAGFLLSDSAIDNYGVLKLVRQNGFGLIALAEIVEPGSTLYLDPTETSIPDQTHSSGASFAMDLLCQLPEVESPFPQMKGWVQQGKDVQVVFWQSDDGCTCGTHAHPYPEWGTIVSGHTEVQVNGETKTYRQGDSFYIPANAAHSATMSKNYRAIDLFGSPNHVKVK